MKDYIVSEFRQAAGLLGRHSGFASSYRDEVTGRRVVEIVDEVECGPDVGLAKRAFVRLFGGPGGRFALSFCAAAGLFLGYAYVTGSSPEMPHSVLAALVGISSALLARLLASRFAHERGALEWARGAVERFRKDALSLAKILGFEGGTAKDILDRRFLGHAMKIVASERSAAKETEPASSAKEERAALYSELALARRFTLGKTLQGYFDRAKIEVDNLARRAAVANN